VSPWSERARWALDHHGLAYRVIEHQPFLGERKLRKLVGPSKPRATVPVLIDGDARLTESWEIALYADRNGAGAKLLPEGREDEIRRWTEVSDAGMWAGRALVVTALLGSPAALAEGLPPEVPRWLRPIVRPVARRGVLWFARKYGVRAEDASADRAKLRSMLEKLREGLAGAPYLLGSFSYADIVMATSLQGISPVADAFIPIGPATREVWTQPSLAAEFADLIAWRDRLYERHRGEAA
jgi:glutathione S-transferase